MLVDFANTRERHVFDEKEVTNLICWAGGGMTYQVKLSLTPEDLQQPIVAKARNI